jgi:flagellar basal-body rod protein FlgB
MKSLFDANIALTGRVLDLRSERQNVVMSNLANIKTPGYKALELKWEDELQAALGRDAKGKLSTTSEQHLPAVFNAKTFNGEGLHAFQPHTVKGMDSVDLDKEMAKMSKNTLMYNALVTVVKSNFEGLKTVITEGSK